MLSDEVMKQLERNKGEFVSGAKLAAEIGVSRTAIWKAVAALKEQGFPIDCVNKRGYCLTGDMISEEGIRKYMIIDAYKFRFYDVVTSTNDIAKQLAAAGEPEGTVAVARTQTAGRGRMGRSFFSPDGCGAYFSIIVRPKRLERLLTVMAACAVADGIEDAGGRHTSIKWVNDVYVGGRKCCGILTEAITDLETGGVDYAVIGIGINVRTPDDGYGKLNNIAVAALDGVQDALNKTIAKVLNRFYELYTFSEKEEIVGLYKERSFVIGKKVKVIKDGYEAPATVLDIDDDCRLVVKYIETLETESLSAGEIKIRLQPTRLAFY